MTQPDEAAWSDATAAEQVHLSAIRQHPVTIGEPVQGNGFWGVSAFPYQHVGVIVVGKGATREAALADLERKLDAQTWRQPDAKT